MEIRTIVVATDFSQAASDALDRALELASTFGARVHVVHAYHLPYMGVGMNVPLPAAYFEELRTEALGRLAGSVRRAQTAGVRATSELVADEPAHAIADTAKQQHADMIAMGTRGLSGLRHALLGSVAERTIRLAPCPVMAVPARD